MIEYKEKRVPISAEIALGSCLDMHFGAIRIFWLNQKPSLEKVRALGKKAAEQMGSGTNLTMSLIHRDEEDRHYLCVTCYRLGSWHPPKKYIDSLIDERTSKDTPGILTIYT